MSVLSDLVVSNVKAYKTRRFQSKSKRKTCTESSIPSLQNHVFLSKFVYVFYAKMGWQSTQQITIHPVYPKLLDHDPMLPIILKRKKISENRKYTKSEYHLQIHFYLRISAFLFTFLHSCKLFFSILALFHTPRCVESEFLAQHVYTHILVRFHIVSWGMHTQMCKPSLFS